ncbi:MAG TPA: hypothetical protein VF099_02650, partial [Ktedonobacterales bacterium]
MSEPAWRREELDGPTPGGDEGCFSTFLVILTLALMLVLIVGVTYIVVTNAPGPAVPVTPNAVRTPSPAASTPTLAVSPTSTTQPTTTPTQSPTPT